MHQYEYWADKFQQLPMYFMGFYGAVNIITVIEVQVYGCWSRVCVLSLSSNPSFHPSSLSLPSPQTMSHAAYVHDIQHVIVDNLQFMLGSNYQVNDRYTVQNQAIAEFRKFASAKNIHVSVVIHPRKVGVCVGVVEGGHEWVENWGEPKQAPH